MKTLLLCIGTEKTGTTTLQRFLHVNRAPLERQGIAYPRSPGLTNHRALAIYAMAGDRVDDAIRAAGLQESFRRAQWRVEFREIFGTELARLDHRVSKVILSSEHCQSRLVSISEIQRLHDLLHPYFDRIEILVYLRRQDELAVSRYNTRIKSGQICSDVFYPRDAKSPYYDYRRLLDHWSAVFGREALRPRVFDRQRLTEGSIIHDFATAAGLDLSMLKLTEDRNCSLSATALEILRIFNQLVPADTPVAAIQALRRRYIRYFEQWHPGPRRRPSRESAVTFYRQFAESNAAVAREWFDDRALFNEDFSHYPEIEEPARIDPSALIPIFGPVIEKLGHAQPRSRLSDHAPDLEFGDANDLEQLAKLLASLEL
ncbi:hypothetical protein CCR95_04580 [Thiocystis minor]|uniref:hypothetical protein n=1 Tax=Thiocystis minor TaxID=61597 RepID=UPI0019133B16|nr:hypothetical protein [Thiocystis minor]MBK5963384.1 hypothetical protein [Thiocystis minor]